MGVRHDREARMSNRFSSVWRTSRSYLANDPHGANCLCYWSDPRQDHVAVRDGVPRARRGRGRVPVRRRVAGRERDRVHVHRARRQRRAGAARRRDRRAAAHPAGTGGGRTDAAQTGLLRSHDPLARRGGMLPGPAPGRPLRSAPRKHRSRRRHALGRPAELPADWVSRPAPGRGYQVGKIVKMLSTILQEMVSARVCASIGMRDALLPASWLPIAPMLPWIF